jgi:hypothetical protein
MTTTPRGVATGSGGGTTTTTLLFRRATRLYSNINRAVFSTDAGDGTITTDHEGEDKGEQTAHPGNTDQVSSSETPTMSDSDTTTPSSSAAATTLVSQPVPVWTSNLHSLEDSTDMTNHNSDILSSTESTTATEEETTPLTEAVDDAIPSSVHEGMNGEMDSLSVSLPHNEQEEVHFLLPSLTAPSTELPSTK